MSDLSALTGLDKRKLFSLSADVSHLTSPERRLLSRPPRMAGPDRRGWGEGPDWMVPDVVAKTRGPFWGHVQGILRRLIANRSARLDAAGGAARVFAVFLRSAHKESGILHNPLTGEGYPGIATIARIAKTSESVTKRVRKLLVDEGYLIFTKHFREKNDAGEWKSEGPSMRRWSWTRFFAGMPPTVQALFKQWLAKALENERKAEAARLEVEAAQRRAALDAQLRAAQAKRKPLPPQQALPRLDSRSRMELMEAIKAEHPEWDGPELFAELRRRAAAPPTGGASETQTSEGPTRKS